MQGRTGSLKRTRALRTHRPVHSAPAAHAPPLQHAGAPAGHPAPACPPSTPAAWLQGRLPALAAAAGLTDRAAALDGAAARPPPPDARPRAVRRLSSTSHVVEHVPPSLLLPPRRFSSPAPAPAGRLADGAAARRVSGTAGASSASTGSDVLRAAPPQSRQDDASAAAMLLAAPAAAQVATLRTCGGPGAPPVAHRTPPRPRRDSRSALEISADVDLTQLQSVRAALRTPRLGDVPLLSYTACVPCRPRGLRVHRQRVFAYWYVSSQPLCLLRAIAAQRMASSARMPRRRSCLLFRIYAETARGAVPRVIAPLSVCAARCRTCLRS